MAPSSLKFSNVIQVILDQNKISIEKLESVTKIVDLKEIINDTRPPTEMEVHVLGQSLGMSPDSKEYLQFIVLAAERMAEIPLDDNVYSILPMLKFESHMQFGFIVSLADGMRMDQKENFTQEPTAPELDSV